MLMPARADVRPRELAQRTIDGINVRLLWCPGTNRVAIVLEDERSGQFLWFEVDGARRVPPPLRLRLSQHCPPPARSMNTTEENDREQPHP